MSDPLILAALYDATEKACRAVYRKRKTIDEAVNWADLHVVTVEHVTELYREEITERYRVWIEEAAPDCIELTYFIREHLAKHGFSGVEVRTEW